jgi:hypothetical protein
MAFDNDYPNRKDRIKPYRKSKAFDRTCRNHGSCAYCRLGRLHNHKKRELGAKEQIHEVENGITQIPLW